MSAYNEEDLIAYHLHLLTPDEERTLRAALEIDPNFAAQSEAIAATLRMFDKKEGNFMVDAAVLDRNWQRVRPTLEVFQPQRHSAWWRVAAIAAMLVMLLLGGRAVWYSKQGSGGVGRSASDQPDTVTSAMLPPSSVPEGSSKPMPFPAAQLAHIGSYAVAAAHPDLASRPKQQPELPLLSQAFQVESLTGARVLDMLAAAPIIVPAPQQNRPLQQSTPALTKKRKTHETDIAVGVSGDVTAARSPGMTSGSGATVSSEERSQAVAPSVGARLTLHQQLRPRLGYNISGGYTRTTFNYTYGASNAVGGFLQRGGISTSVFELSSAYVAQGPRAKRISSFAEVGGGLLSFLPTNSNEPDSYVFRGAAVAGVGMDYKLNDRWSLRAEYRGVYFKGPDFRYSGGTVPVISKYTLTSQPTVSLTYRFGSHPK